MVSIVEIASLTFVLVGIANTLYQAFGSTALLPVRNDRLRGFQLCGLRHLCWTSVVWMNALLCSVDTTVTGALLRKQEANGDAGSCGCNGISS